MQQEKVTHQTRPPMRAATRIFSPNTHEKKATDTQVGGVHYKDMAIQPAEYIHKNRLGYLEGLNIKYVSRHRTKGGADDLRKAIHVLELLLQLEYGETAHEGSDSVKQRNRT